MQRNISCVLIAIFFTFSSFAQKKSGKIFFIDTHNDILSTVLITGEDISNEGNVDKIGW